MRGNPLSHSTVDVKLKSDALVGKFLMSWGSSGKEDGQFSYPFGVAAGLNEIYVSDNNHRIQVFDAHGRFRRKWGSQGNSNGQLTYRCGMAWSNGELFVCDWSNHRI